MNDQFPPEEVAKIVGPLLPLPKMKFVMVSVWFRGQKKTVFTHVPVGQDGKVRFDYDALAGTMGAEHGDTYSQGW